jgi:ATP-dependent Lhr-like helicase
VSAFEHLHPSVQFHIVNSLGWDDLRPTQREAIEPILNRRHVLILAPTAGGKTEAAAFPILSRMLTEQWAGLSVLYVCPLRALLNNLEPRLSRYAGLVGRSAALWHGDVAQRQKRGILREPPDILLTTPESLEAMLISRRVDRVDLFANLQTVIVDELHAFAGDDRGWHLLAIVERIGRTTGRPLQRLGLSATIGNPSTLLGWLTCGEEGDVVGRSSGTTDSDVAIDYVGSLENATLALSRIYRGEKRLVFCDSRARVEALAAGLRARDVATFVSHGSLGGQERRRSEEAFATGSDCVIVATSTLELGIDVGDLDRVVQIDAPGSVSAFLQRMGRTGRRVGTKRNCLFLATSDDAFLEALGIGTLWGEGFVEPVVPPPRPNHLFAQQVMALVLQEGGLACSDWKKWIGRVFPEGDFAEVIGHMLDSGLLASDGGILGIGPRGEQKFGARNFLDLLSAFTTPLLFTIRYGSTELGQVDPVSFQQKDGATSNVLLGGRSWKVRTIDWRRRLAFVEPTGETGRSQWFGSSRGLQFNLVQAIERALIHWSTPVALSRRATDRLRALSDDFSFCDGKSLPIVTGDRNQMRWWTFAGVATNMMLATALRSRNVIVHAIDDFGLTSRTMTAREAAAVFQAIHPADVSVPLPYKALGELKFSSCLPKHIAEETLRNRLFAVEPMRRLLTKAPKMLRNPARDRPGLGS